MKSQNKNLLYLLIAFVLLVCAYFGICHFKDISDPLAKGILTVSEIVTIVSVLGIGVTLIATFITNEEARDVAKVTNMISTLEDYLKIYEYRLDAVVEKDPDARIEKAKHYWRALLDLQWTEYRLYKKKFIDTEIFATWTFSKYLNYIIDTVTKIKTDNEVAGVTLRQVWDELNEVQYFKSNDCFRNYMEAVFRLTLKTIPKDGKLIIDTDKMKDDIKEKIKMHIDKASCQ